MLLFFSVVLILAASFFCSLSEASLLSSSRARMHQLAETLPAAKLVERLKGKLDRPIAAILILNTLANTGGAAIAGREYERTFGGGSIALFTTLLTLAVLLFSELLPKTLGVRYSTQAVLLVARPLVLLTRVMSPFTYVVGAMTKWVAGSPRPQDVSALDDLRALVRLAVSSKAIGREEQGIIEAAAQLPRTKVHQIMIHARDVVWLNLSDDEETLLRKARQSLHSRLLLCRTRLDDVIGVVHMKEVLWRLVAEPEDREEDGLKRILGESVREPLYVEPGLDASRLLQAFSREHEHLAVVRDKAGQVVGIVTLEDVVEELIGEVDDEYDSSPVKIEQVAPGLYNLGGGTLWADAAQQLQVVEPLLAEQDRDLDGRYDLNDLAADRLPGKLRTGATFVVGHWRFRVSRMRRGKVLYLEAARLGQSNRPSPGPERSVAAAPTNS